MDQSNITYLRARGRAGGLATAVKHPGALPSSGYAAKCARWAATGDFERAKNLEMQKLTLARMSKRMATQKQPAKQSGPKPSTDYPRSCPFCYLRRLKPMPIGHLSIPCKQHAHQTTDD